MVASASRAPRRPLALASLSRPRSSWAQAARTAIAGHLDRRQLSRVHVLTRAGKEPPLTAEGSEAYRANLADATTAQPQFDRTRWCAGPGVPRIMFMPTPFEIVVNPKLVGFIYGWYRWHRAVDMSGEPAEPLLPQPMGYPVGHWEGDTLVIVSNGLIRRHHPRRFGSAAWRRHGTGGAPARGRQATSCTYLPHHRSRILQRAVGDRDDL